MLAPPAASIEYAQRLAERDLSAARRKLALAELALAELALVEAQRARQRAVCREHQLADQLVLLRRQVSNAERAAAAYAEGRN